jgi:hypothetical protein
MFRTAQGNGVGGQEVRRARIWLAAALVVGSLALPSSGASTTWTHGFDVSWPQCSGARAHHLPSDPGRYVVVGLTHGAGHTPNPCLPGQVGWARAHRVAIAGYLVPSYPTRAQLARAKNGFFGRCGTLRCRLRNDGASQVVDALAGMRRAGLDLPMIWVDVEYRYDPAWSGHHDRNRAVLSGVLDAVRDTGLRVGVYTTSYMWGHITGGWRVDVPNWLPAGTGNARTARRRCAASGTGGVTWLVQYTREWDEDLTCPVMDATPGRPGPLWRYRDTTLSAGASGEAVMALQQALGITATGDYDVATTAAVVRFQSQNALPVTGSVNSDDWRALGAWRRVGAHPFLLGRMTGH